MDPMEQIFTEAVAAAKKAIADELSIRSEGQFDFDCGFAWVVVKPARGPFISWCKKQIKVGGRQAETTYGHSHYAGGWCFWEPGKHVGQSVRVHAAGARAFAAVLHKHGINAYSDSRLD